MGFTNNQVRNLYVAKELKSASLLATDGAGSILPKVSNGTLMFQYKSPAGIMGSDKIDVDKILYAKATSSDSMAHKLALKKVVIDNKVSATPVEGEEYLLRVSFRNYIGMGDENTVDKYGVAKATSATSVSDLYKELAVSLANHIGKDTTPLAKVYLDATEVKPGTKTSALTGSYSSIQIEEVEQDWDLGRMPQAFIPFDIFVGKIKIENEEYTWGVVTNETPKNLVENGKKIAEMEYFYMGVRGDYYRGVGYPHNLKTTYLVDPAKKYDTLDIHYAYVGSNESVQKSEKDITIVCENTGNHALINSLIGAINSAAKLEIATLEVEE